MRYSACNRFWFELFVEALAMEREQIEQAFDVGLDTGSETPPSIYNFESDEPSEYYNHTYKGGEQ